MDIKPYSLFEFDERFRDSYKVIGGADEAGRGPWAGPVAAAIVILPQNARVITDLVGINDSKKLTHIKRKNLFDIIKREALAYSIAFTSEKDIDKFNIWEATKSAIRESLTNIEIKPDLLLVDGTQKIDELDVNQRNIIKGDGRSATIAAASILAKVARDNFMEEMDKKYPGYFFSKHKGYGTALHMGMLAKYGPCPIHRMSFKPIQRYL